MSLNSLCVLRSTIFLSMFSSNVNKVTCVTDNLTGGYQFVPQPNLLKGKRTHHLGKHISHLHKGSSANQIVLPIFLDSQNTFKNIYNSRYLPYICPNPKYVVTPYSNLFHTVIIYSKQWLVFGVSLLLTAFDSILREDDYSSWVDPETTPHLSSTTYPAKDC